MVSSVSGTELSMLDSNGQVAQPQQFSPETENLALNLSIASLALACVTLVTLVALLVLVNDRRRQRQRQEEDRVSLVADGKSDVHE